MILYPAIDLKDGKCVRLLRGDMKSSIIFNESPTEQALIFEDEGCKWLHLVDLDGAISGSIKNIKEIKSILGNVEIPVQLGGGIRDMATIAHWIKEGVSRIILGTVALQKPELVEEACENFPGKIAVAIDAKNGKVVSHGWVNESDYNDIELAKRYEDLGVCAIIYTDIDFDGAMGGVNEDRTIELSKSVSIPVIASGGVAGWRDLQSLKDLNTNLNGIICGRAIYEKKLDIKQALDILNGK